MRNLSRLLRRVPSWIFEKASPIKYARWIGVQVGRDCRLASCNFGSEPYLVRLGDRVEVTAGVEFITHDGAVWVLRDRRPEIDVIAPIEVGDHSFLGANAIILPGVRIGHHVIVGAGAVVTRDVPDETVVAGIPARHVCSLAEYERKLDGRTISTKLLPRKEKHRFLREHFAAWRHGREEAPSPAHAEQHEEGSIRSRS